MVLLLKECLQEESTTLGLDGDESSAEGEAVSLSFVPAPRLLDEVVAETHVREESIRTPRIRQPICNPSCPSCPGLRYFSLHCASVSPLSRPVFFCCSEAKTVMLIHSVLCRRFEIEKAACVYVPSGIEWLESLFLSPRLRGRVDTGAFSPLRRSKSPPPFQNPLS